MRIAQEEVFGPVLVIIRSRDVDEALAVENASPYGNAASVFTESGGIARYVMERASAGMVGVNVGVPVPREPFSFGGWNESKFGVGDITGRGSIEFWTQVEEDDDEVESGGGGELDVVSVCAMCHPERSEGAMSRVMAPSLSLRMTSEIQESHMSDQPFRHASPGFSSRIPSSSPPLRRPSRRATSSAPSRPGGAAWSPRRSGSTRSSTSSAPRPSSCAPRPRTPTSP